MYTYSYAYGPISTFFSGQLCLVSNRPTLNLADPDICRLLRFWFAGMVDLNLFGGNE